MGDTQANLVQGSLEVLILKALSLQSLHGLGISRRIEQMSRGTFQVKPGSLFPALYRMERMGWVVASWGQSPTGKRAKYYVITAAGRRHLKAEAAHWTRLALALQTSLEST
jgi:transcriptional regulator